MNSQGGYCLLYPDSHTAVKGGFDSGEPAGIRIVNGSILNTDLWASILVGDATGSDLAQSAREDAERLSEFDVELTEIEVAGEPAYMLTGLPGQDLTRNIRFEHDGILYSFQIGPDDVAGSETFRRVNEFTATLLDSLTFIPVNDVITLVDECLLPRPDEKLILNESLDFCLLIPFGYVYEEPDQNSAVFHGGTVVDADHPKLSIMVTDAGNKPAEEVTDVLLREMNDLTGEPVLIRLYTIGNGNILVTMLDGAPGQELERVLLIDHDGRRYRLAFTPYDPSQPELTGAMEAFITQVTQSFRFLP